MTTSTSSTMCSSAILVAGFLLCVIAMWRQKPYRQIQRKSFGLRGDPTLHAAQTKEQAMAENEHRFRRICKIGELKRTPTGAA